MSDFDVLLLFLLTFSNFRKIIIVSVNKTSYMIKIENEN